MFYPIGRPAPTLRVPTTRANWFVILMWPVRTGSSLFVYEIQITGEFISGLPLDTVIGAELFSKCNG